MLDSSVGGGKGPSTQEALTGFRVVIAWGQIRRCMGFYQDISGYRVRRLRAQVHPIDENKPGIGAGIWVHQSLKYRFRGSCELLRTWALRV